MDCKFVVVLVGFLHVTSSLDVPFEVTGTSMSQTFENGKKRMDELMTRANLPSDAGTCWKSALEYLQAGCKLMSEDIQARMAFRFTSCFSEMLGLNPSICENSTPIKECVKGLDAMGMATFREYFLHSQDMCYYLRQELWQEETNNAVNRLTTAAVDVTEQMTVQKDIQEQIYNSQQESLKVQSNLKKDNEDLYNAVVRVKDVFDDFSETAREHQHISSEIFDKLSRMQRLISWIQSEMSTLEMIFFYFGAILFGYFATTTSRTKSARFFLTMLFMSALSTEKFAFSHMTSATRGHLYTPEDVQICMSWIRKLAAGIGVFMIIFAAATYRDAQVVNNNMLENLTSAMDQVVAFINEQRVNFKDGANARESIAETFIARMAQNDEDSDDSFSNYSTDDSRDDLENELQALNDNTENLEPTATGSRPSYSEKDSEVDTSSTFSVPRLRYSLRARSSAPRENPIVHEESVTDFARAVKRNKILRTNATTNHPNNSYFSSDDE